MAQTANLMPERPRLSRRTTVFLACLGLSAFLWLMRYLSQDYDQTLPLRVEYVGQPEERILMNTPPDHVDMKVQAMGFDVLWHMLRPHRQTLTIDLSETPLRKVTHESEPMQFLLTASQLDKARILMSSSIKVTHLYPDTLYFHFVERQSKKLPVKLAGDITYDDDAAPSGNVRIVPAKVTVFGPKKLLADLDHIETENVKWADINESISTKVALKPLADTRLMSMEEKEVEVQIDVIAVESKEFKVPVSVLGKMAARRWIPAPEEVKITVKGTANRLAKLTAEDFNFSVNTADAKQGDRVKVRCDKRPQGIADLTWKPEEVQLKAR